MSSEDLFYQSQFKYFKNVTFRLLFFLYLVILLKKNGKYLKNRRNFSSIDTGSN